MMQELMKDMDVESASVKFKLSLNTLEHQHVDFENMLVIKFTHF